MPARSVLFLLLSAALCAVPVVVLPPFTRPLWEPWLLYVAIAAWNAGLWARLCAPHTHRVMGAMNRSTNYLVKSHDQDYRMEGPWWTGFGQPEGFMVIMGISRFPEPVGKAVAALYAVALLGGWAVWGREWGKVALLTPFAVFAAACAAYLLNLVVEQLAPMIEGEPRLRALSPVALQALLALLWAAQLGFPLWRLSWIA